VSLCTIVLVLERWWSQQDILMYWIWWLIQTK
jgi:hypothetical protein